MPEEQRNNTERTPDNDATQAAESRPTPWWRRVLRGIGYTLLGIVGLLILLTLLLYIPPIQRWVTNTTLEQLQSSLGMRVTVGDMRVGFPVKILLEDVLAIDETENDTVAQVDRLVANVSVLPLLRGSSVPVSSLELLGTYVNYRAPSDSLSIHGRIAELKTNALIYGLSSQEITIDRLSLREGDVSVTALSDTIPDTVPKDPSRLVIKLNDIRIQELRGSFENTIDSTLISAYVRDLKLKKGEVNLPGEFYQADHLDLEGEMYAVGAEIEMLPLPWRLAIDGDNIRYGGASDVRAVVNSLWYETGDGWRVSEGKMDLAKDSLMLRAGGLDIRLDKTRLTGDAELPFRGWIPDTIGPAEVALKGQLLATEVARFIGNPENLPSDLISFVLNARGKVEDNLRLSMNLKGDEVITADVDGKARAIFDEKLRSIQADYSLATGKKTIGLVHRLMGTTSTSWTIPSGLNLSGNAQYTPTRMQARLNLDCKGGSMQGDLSYRSAAKQYKAHLTIRDLNLGDFLPKDTIGTLSGVMQVEGLGTDIYSPRTHANAFVNIDSLHLKQQTFRDISLISELKEQHLFAALDANHEALKVNTLVNAMLIPENVDVNLNMYVDTIIPSVIGLNIPVIEGARLELRSNLNTDLKERYAFSGEVENFFIRTDKNTIHPTNTYINADVDSTKVNADLTSGDLAVRLAVQNGLNDFTGRIKKVSELVSEALKDTISSGLNMSPWMAYYPDLDFSIDMGRNNLLRAYLDQHRIGAQKVHFALTSHTGEGLTGDGFVKYFQQDTLRIDDMDLILRQDSSFVYVVASAHKERFRNQQPFDVMASVTTNVHRSEAIFRWIDHQEKDFLRMGVELWNRPNGDLELGFTPEPIVLAYNPFSVRGEDYVILPAENKKHVRANLRLESPDGAAIHLKDVPSEVGHRLEAEVEDFELNILSGLSFLPPLAGVLNAGVSYVQAPKTTEYAADVTIDGLTYENKKLGDIRLTGSSDQDQVGAYTKAELTLNDKQVLHALLYDPQGKETPQRIYAQLDNLPLELANPFIPDNLADARGAVSATLANYDTAGDIRQMPTRTMQGQIRFEEATLFVPKLNETYDLDSKPINITNDEVVLKAFNITANDNKLTTNGTVGLFSKDLPLDLRIQGNNLALLESKQTANTLVYGNLTASTDLRVNGPARAIDLTGYVSILGSTDLTYVNQNSDLQMRNGYSGLVEFTDFTDTLFVAKKRDIDSLSLGGANVNLAVHIDPATQVTYLMARDGKNAVSVKGGGDFSFTMPPYGEMQLAGLYSIEDGYVNASIGVGGGVGLNYKFDIDRGSQLAWSGELLEPDINFRATTHVTSRVTGSGEVPRQVAFDVSIIAENTLDDLRLRFETRAPEDLEIRNQLAGMNEQEQTRQSIMLLATKQYVGNGIVGSGGTGQSTGDLMNNAMASLVASQLTSLAGEALGADINFGISDGTTDRGQGTNYSYSIAKSFMNDRINVIVGGKVMTGAAAYGMNQTFIDNMSIEYQLDQAGTHYLRLFHNKNYENLLDGEVIETGGGYVLRRRLSRLKDLFNFRQLRSATIIPEEEDEEEPSDATETRTEAPLPDNETEADSSPDTTEKTRENSAAEHEN